MNFVEKCEMILDKIVNNNHVHRLKMIIESLRGQVRVEPTLNKVVSAYPHYETLGETFEMPGKYLELLFGEIIENPDPTEEAMLADLIIYAKLKRTRSAANYDYLVANMKRSYDSQLVTHAATKERLNKAIEDHAVIEHSLNGMRELWTELTQGIADALEAKVPLTHEQQTLLDLIIKQSKYAKTIGENEYEIDWPKIENFKSEHIRTIMNFFIHHSSGIVPTKKEIVSEG